MDGCRGYGWFLTVEVVSFKFKIIWRYIVIESHIEGCIIRG